MAPKLTVRNGDLFLGDEILLIVYPAGDCDTIGWTDLDNVNREHLQVALYDAVMKGELPPNCQDVELPNGETFFIEGI
jgi:hypothetical protein